MRSETETALRVLADGKVDNVEYFISDIASTITNFYGLLQFEDIDLGIPTEQRDLLEKIADSASTLKKSIEGLSELSWRMLIKKSGKLDWKESGRESCRKSRNMKKDVKR